MPKKWKRAIWSCLLWTGIFITLLLSACALKFPGGQPGADQPEPTITSVRIITSTPSKTAVFTKTPTPEQTASPAPTVHLTATLAPTVTPLTPTLPSKPYSLQPGSPKYLPAFTHPDQGCQWLGVAGQVFDGSGTGVKGLAVLVTGDIAGQPVERAVLTGEQGDYGPGGYEVFLADGLPGNAAAFQIQLFDLQDQPLSDPLLVPLPENCDQNLVLLNFRPAN